MDPACPKGLIQWQHGTFEKTAAGELKLSPIADDGRQLLSDPCKFDVGVYTRYSKNETFKVHTYPTHTHTQHTTHNQPTTNN